MRNGGQWALVMLGCMIKRSICFGLKRKPEDHRIGIVDGEGTVTDTAGGSLLRENARSSVTVDSPQHRDQPRRRKGGPKLDL